MWDREVTITRSRTPLAISAACGYHGPAPPQLAGITIHIDQHVFLSTYVSPGFLMARVSIGCCVYIYTCDSDGLCMVVSNAGHLVICGHTPVYMALPGLPP